MLQIDGSYGEGGGQIVRTALLLSLLTGKPFHAFSIRKGRKKPGLKPQHLNILKALRKLTSSRIDGAVQGSTEITFVPGKIRGGRIEIDFKTAGSITLFMQTILPVSTFASSRVSIKVRGGTDVPMSMTFDYFRHVIAPIVMRFTHGIDINLVQRGFYPRGGGEVEFLIKPGVAASQHGNFDDFRKAVYDMVGPLDFMDRGKLRKISVYSMASHHLRERKVAHRQLMAAESLLKEANCPIDRHISYERALSPGSAITLVAEFTGNGLLGSDAIGKRGVPSEKIGKEAARKLMSDLKAGSSVDVNLADNLIPLMGLVGGSIVVREVTSHIKTNIWITELFMGRSFRIEKRGTNFVIKSSSPG